MSDLVVENALANEKNKLTDEYVSALFDKVFAEPADAATSTRELSWFRNILYYLGEQWLSWFEQSHTFGRRYELSGNMPTPVSNEIREYVRSTKALILNKHYSVRVWPNSRERQDIEAAELGVDMIRWMDAMDDYVIEDIKEIIVLWMLMTGNGFARIFAEVDDGVYIVDKSGKGRSKGDVVVDAVMPFNLVVPHSGVLLEKKPWVGLKSLKPKEWVEDTFKIKVEQSEGDKDLVEYERQLMKLVANVSPWKMRGVDVDTETPNEELVLFREIEFRPTKDYPKGRYTAMAGSTVVRKVDSMPIPVSKSGKCDYSIVHFPYNLTPGSLWATSGIDDLISPQNEINEIDQALSVNRKSLGRPFLLSPAQVTLRRLSSRGQALLAVEYDGRNAGGARPQVHPGVPYPEQIHMERQNKRQAIQDSGGDPKNVLRGQSPHSGASGTLVDTLREAAEMSHSPDITRFYRNWSKVQRKRLSVAQVLYTETRMLKVPGEGNNIKIRAFKGSDLKDNTDVRLELDTAMSSTQAGRNAMMTQLMGAGFFGDLAMQPRLRREIGKRMGMGTLPDEENLHQDKAEMEDSVIAFGTPEDLKIVALPNAPMKGEDGTPMVFPSGQPISLFPRTFDPTFRYDNHAVHLKIHLEFVLSAEFRTLERKRQQYAIAHMDMHREALEVIDEENTKKQAAKVAMGVTEPGGGGAPPAPPAPMAGPAGMMPERMQMQGQEGGMRESYGNY